VLCRVCALIVGGDSVLLAWRLDCQVREEDDFASWYSDDGSDPGDTTYNDRSHLPKGVDAYGDGGSAQSKALVLDLVSRDLQSMRHQGHHSVAPRPVSSLLLFHFSLI
jgi:hypothetical protein